MKNKSGQDIEKALDLYARKAYDDSLNLSIKLLKKNPENLSLLINCGNIFHLKQDYKKALEYYYLAEKISPENKVVLHNLANSSYDSGDYLNAADYALRKLRLQYDSAAAGILGASFIELEKYKAAAEILERKIKYETTILKQIPSDWDYAYLAEAWLKNGQEEKALPVLENLVSKKIEDENLQLNLGYVFYDFIRENKADSLVEIIKSWKKNNPDSPNANHWADAFLQAPEHKDSNPDYVQKIFDVFAPGFEKLLTELEYKVPSLMEVFCKEFLKQKTFSGYDILDAGCGTGWCGKFLKKYSRFSRLDGVDLSSGMLAEAKQKNIYNSLILSDINSYMSQCQTKYDIVLAADVLTYFGRLDSFFENVQKCLKKNGLVFFSVSENTRDDKDFVLHLSGRFLHKESYVEKCFEKEGFQKLKSVHEILRKEGGEPVWGYVYVIKKTS